MNKVQRRNYHSAVIAYREHLDGLYKVRDVLLRKLAQYGKNYPFGELIRHLYKTELLILVIDKALLSAMSMEDVSRYMRKNSKWFSNILNYKDELTYEEYAEFRKFVDGEI